MPKDISSEEELYEFLEEVKQIQVSNDFDIESLSFEEINYLIKTYERNKVFDKLIEEHNEEYISNKIKDIENVELKEKLIEKNKDAGKKREEKRRIATKKKELTDYIHSTDSLLVPVVFHNQSRKEDFNEAIVCDAVDRDERHGTYYKDDKSVQVLYTVKEDGEKRDVYSGMIINVDLAKKKTKKGKLHFDIPGELMGRIIGSRGRNINEVTEQLQEKGVDVSKIILHPKSKEEMEIKLKEIKEAIEQNKSKNQETNSSGDRE